MLKTILVAATMMTFFALRPASADYVNTSSDLRIHYEVSGKGPKTILFVPGWTMTTEVFEKQLAHFKDSEKYTFITYDPRGQGLSSKTSGGNYYEQHGKDLAAFIDALKLDNIILGGWSNAGFDILAYVHQFGSAKIDALVMIDAAPSGRTKDNKNEWGWYLLDDGDRWMESFFQGALLDRTKMNEDFAKWMVSDEGATPSYMKWVDRLAGYTSDDVAALLTASSFFQEYSKDLAALEGKVGLFYITQPSWKDTVQKWADTHTPSATVAVMDKHLSFWEKPEQFNEPFDVFLKKIEK